MRGDAAHMDDSAAACGVSSNSVVARKQGLTGLGDGGNRHPACLPHTQIFQSTIKSLTP
jgi:hypothetical protein